MLKIGTNLDFCFAFYRFVIMPWFPHARNGVCDLGSNGKPQFFKVFFEFRRNCDIKMHGTISELIDFCYIDFVLASDNFKALTKEVVGRGHFVTCMHNQPASAQI